MDYDRNVVVAFDFDGTLTRGSEYGRTGKLDGRALWWYGRIRSLGVRTVLWSTREGADRDEMMEILLEAEVTFDHVDEYPLRESGRKVNADVYVDDRANDGRIRWVRTYLRVRNLVRARGSVAD